MDQRAVEAAPHLAERARAPISRPVVLLCGVAAAGSVVDGVIVGGLKHMVTGLHTTPSGVFGLLVTLGAARLVAGGVIPALSRRFGPWRVVAVGAAVAGLATMAMAGTTDIGTAAALAIVIGVATAPLTTTHLALARDHIGLHTASRAAGFVAAAALATAVSRAACLLGVAGIVLAVVAWREPRPAAQAVPHIAARLSRLRSRGALSAAIAVGGFVAVGLPPFLNSYFRHRHTTTGGQTAILIAAGAAAVIGAMAARNAHRTVVASGGFAVLAGGLALAGAGVTWAVVLAAAGLAASMVGVASIIGDVVPAVIAEDAFAIAGLVGAFWALTGAVVASAARSAWGSSGVLLALAGGAAAAAALLITSAAAISEDCAGAAQVARPRPAKSAALEVEGVNFAYGTQPVLFDVTVRVAEGEIAALLGTNGAGKSTLLRLIAGLDHPHRGSISVFGEDTTYVDAEQLLGHGVALLSGGRMTFPGLTVAENIRVGTQKAAARAVAESEAYEAFPILAERRDQRAGTLSGGEQQMLALARVLVMRPRLLLLDELTLGLAPRIIEQLLATVRTVNQRGATILLVEQSANLALDLADHAFFMERGAVRFDGRPADLHGRGDLLRPVFLG